MLDPQEGKHVVVQGTYRVFSGVVTKRTEKQVRVREHIWPDSKPARLPLGADRPAAYHRFGAELQVGPAHPDCGHRM